MKLSKWKLMALIIPAAWTSISYAYDWNDDVTQRVQTLIENAANKYVQGDYDSYNSDTETAINLLLTVEPQPQSPEQIDARKILAAQLVDETVKKEIISLEQSLEENQAVVFLVFLHYWYGSQPATDGFALQRMQLVSYRRISTLLIWELA